MSIVTARALSGAPRRLLILVLSTLAATPAAASSFTGLGTLPGGGPRSMAYDVSDDGTTVVGWSRSPNFGSVEAFRWTAGGGMVGLGDLPGGTFYSEASGVSADGGTVVGESSGKAFLWTSGSMRPLVEVPPGVINPWSNTSASDITPDSRTVVGWGFSSSGAEAFRWTSGGGDSRSGRPSRRPV